MGKHEPHADDGEPHPTEHCHKCGGALSRGDVRMGYQHCSPGCYLADDSDTTDTRHGYDQPDER